MKRATWYCKTQYPDGPLALLPIDHLATGRMYPDWQRRRAAANAERFDRTTHFLFGPRDSFGGRAVARSDGAYVMPLICAVCQGRVFRKSL